MSNSPRTRLIAAAAAGTGLVAGLGLGVTGLASASTSTPTAPKTGTAAGTHEGHGDRDHRGGGALVQSVNGTASITIDTPRGVKTVAVTPATVYKRGTATASLSDVKRGEIVRVRFVDPEATNLVAKDVRIEPARAAGYVTAVNGTSFTVTGKDGFSRTIQESPTTVYRNAGTAGSAAEVTVGKFIVAQGIVDQNGTTLDAARIGTGGGAGRGHGKGMRMNSPAGPPAGTGTTTAPDANG